MNAAAPPPVPENTTHSRVYTDRRKALELAAKRGGDIVEVGTLTGALARFMLTRIKPRSLTVMDISSFPINQCRKRTSAVGTSVGAKVECIIGDSAKNLAKLPDDSQDLIYIDGDHNYRGVCADLESARSKLRVGGLLVMNDYHWFETDFFMSRGRWGVYGVIHATNEFAVRYASQFEVAYYAMHGRNQGDFALRKVA